jgi:hypothetical protein
MRRRPENEKTPMVVIRKIGAAILDEVFLLGVPIRLPAVRILTLAFWSNPQRPASRAKKSL